MSSSETPNNKSNVMIKIATFIVDKRNLFFLLFGIAIIFSCVSSGWVNVENSLTEYLPNTTETRRGVDLMDEEFITYGTAKVMVANISYDQAEILCDKIEGMDGVQDVVFEDDEDHYLNSSALYEVTFSYDENDDKCLEALDNLKQQLAGNDIYIDTDLGDQNSETLANEISHIMVYAAIIIVAVLLLTSQTYAELPVLIITFIAAAIINMGTNYLFGTISFVSNSVAVILQLALSIDYAIIFCNRYKEEHIVRAPREAVIVALSKSIPEIASSSLTTIGGLLAMCFMQYGIGRDLGIVLTKAILLSLITVFTLMPGLLMLFSNFIDKTHHRNFVPKVPFIGRFAFKTRKVIPPLFFVVMLLGFYFSGLCPYVYGHNTLKTPKLNQYQIARNMINDNFGSENKVAVIVPAGDYNAERAFLAEMDTFSEVDSSKGLANIEAEDGYMLADNLTPRQFSELVDIDYEAAQLLYTAYFIDSEDYGQIVGNLKSSDVPLIDMFMFLYDAIHDGYVTVDDDTMQDIDDAYKQMSIAKDQLQGKNYSRMLLYLNLPSEGDETFAFLDKIHEVADKYFDGDRVILAGDSTSQYDLSKTFEHDNIIVSIMSVLIVMAVLLFTFKSAGMPILLIMIIQGSIWINFSIPYLTHSRLFFMSYLIVSAIQMGANVDYAIVISSRFMELREKMPVKDAIIETMNLSFPTIITSGTILASAAILIGQMTSDTSIVGIGQSLGRGTIISIILVLFVLPGMLILGCRIIDKTSFSVSLPIKKPQRAQGKTVVGGVVRARVNGTITGTVHGVIDGDIEGYFESEGNKFEDKQNGAQPDNTEVQEGETNE